MALGSNKIFLELAGESILLRTLRTFSSSARIEFLIVVVGAGEVAAVEAILRAAADLKPWAVVVGGSERQFSVANGLKVLPEAAEIVLVHDAARPLVDVATIDAVAEAAAEFGGAIAAVPEKNTVKFVDAAGFVKSTPSRAELVEVQTPQGFQREILVRAYEKAAADNFLGTDDASLVERIGGRVKVVGGSYRNIKVTTPEDIAIAENFLKGGSS